MADRTLTSSPALSQPVKQPHIGVASVPFEWSAGGTTLAASDVILLAAIPRRATITRFAGSGWSGGAAGYTIQLGLGGRSDDYFSTQTLSNTGTTAFAVDSGRIPTTVSISDDAARPWVYVFAKVVSGTATTTALINGVVEYTMDYGGSI